MSETTPLPGQAPESSEGWSGRPSVHSEVWSKVTVVLLNRQIVYLDRLSADIRATSGAVIKRAEMIRALIDCLAEAKIDPSKIHSEDGLKNLFKSQG